MNRDIRIYLEDIYESIRLIKKYTKGISEKEFSTNPEIQDAVIRRLEIIGEATKHIPNGIRDQFPDIPWREIAVMRDVLTHEYFSLDIRRIWSTIQKDIPKLEQRIKAIIKAR